MNKKKVVTLVIVVLAVALGVWYFNCSPCKLSGGSNNVSIATGGTTGTYFAIGGAIANAVNEGGKLNVTSETGNASVANINLVANKEIEFGFTQADIAYWAYNGELMFKDKPVKNIRAVCALYPEHIQMLVAKEANINKFEDLKGKRVGVGAPGSGVEGDVQALFQQAGLTYNDIKADFLDFAATTSRFKDNQIDAGFVVAGFPTASVMDLMTTKSNITLLSFDDAFLAKLQEAYPFMVPSVIPADTYKGVGEIKTPAITSFLVTYEDADDDMIYNFLEALYEHIDIVQNSHAKGKEITLETATQGLTIPLHPAAEKFFRDKGLIK